MSNYVCTVFLDPHSSYTNYYMQQWVIVLVYCHDCVSLCFVLLLIPVRIRSDSAVMCEHKCFKLLLQPGGATKPQEAFLVCLHPPRIIIRTSCFSFNLPQQTFPTEKTWPLPGSWLKWESTGVVVCFTIAFIWLQELCVAGANPGCAYSSSCWSRISWVCECSTDIKANRLFGKTKDTADMDGVSV